MRSLAALLLVGCGGLPSTSVPLGVTAECGGPLTDADLSAADRTTPTPALECLLARARATSVETAAASRLAFLLADRAPAGARRERLAAEGLRAAEAALARRADDGPAHFYLAVNLGLAVQDHMTLAVKNLGRLERHLKKAVAIDPALDDGGPLRVLGLLYLRAPAWPEGIGDGDKALRLLARAVEGHPRHPHNRLAYAEALWELEEDADAANTQLTAAEAALSARDWGPSAARWQAAIKALRANLE